MRVKLKTQVEGFTIIEVLIVLTIAGLIMLIVFLAVPALQRNSRNTQRRNDIANYLGAVNEWSTNNDGKVPTAADLTATNGGVNVLTKVSTGMTKPTSVASGAAVAPSWSPTNQATPILRTGAKCDSTNIGATTVAGGRAFAMQYAVESSGGNFIPQCQEG